MRKKALKIYAWILGITVPYLIWLMLTGIGIPCFYRETIGLQCPGCGISRMFVNMVKLNFVEAFYCNPLMFVLFIVWNIIGAFCIWERFKLFKKAKTYYILLVITMLAVVAYGFLRNIINYK